MFTLAYMYWKKTQLAGHIGEIPTVYFRRKALLKSALESFTLHVKKCCKIKHFLALYTTLLVKSAVK